MSSFNLDDLVSNSDRDKMRQHRNRPEYEYGFEDEVDSDSLSFFDDLASDPIFGTTGSSNDNLTAAQLAGKFSGFDTTPKQSDPFGQNTFGQSTLGGGGLSSFSTTFNTPEKPKKEPDKLDIALDGLIDSIENSGRVTLSMAKSFSKRTADDWGVYANSMLKTGAIGFVVSFLLAVLGAFGNVGVLKLTGLSGIFMLASLMIVGMGGLVLSIAAWCILEAKKHETIDIDKLVDVGNNNISNEEVENVYEDVFSDLDWSFDDDDDDDDDFDEDEEYSIGKNTSVDTAQFTSAFDDIINKYEEVEPVDFDKVVDNVNANLGIINRETLVRTFKPFLMLNTVGFEARQELGNMTSQFLDMEILLKRALGMACGEDDITKVDIEIESIVETYFSYEVKVKRIKGLNKLDLIDTEIERFFSHPDKGELVLSETTIEGNNYKIIISKGEKSVVTLGDTFRIEEVEEFFLNEKNRIPLVVGIDRRGKVVTADAKHFDSMLIAGKPRSGKSWFVLSLLVAMQLFNKPTDIQMLIIDPKESNLFNTMGLMPHVCGVHNDKDIIRILQDIIDLEAPRRKKLLKDHKCDDIWDFREKTGIEMPILYIVIDEVMSVLENLGTLESNLKSQLAVILTQFPSLGIRLLIVPHRAQGVVEKKFRLNLGFAAAVRAEADVIKETLLVNKWDKELLNPGDMVVKMTGQHGVVQARGAAVATSDSDNAKFLFSAARAFYKMGVDIPDMSTIGTGCIRNENSIEEELYGARDGVKLVQYDENSFDDVDDIDLDEISKKQEEYEEN